VSRRSAGARSSRSGGAPRRLSYTAKRSGSPISPRPASPRSPPAEPSARGSTGSPSGTARVTDGPPSVNEHVQGWRLSASRSSRNVVSKEVCTGASDSVDACWTLCGWPDGSRRNRDDRRRRSSQKAFNFRDRFSTSEGTDDLSRTASRRGSGGSWPGLRMSRDAGARSGSVGRSRWADWIARSADEDEERGARAQSVCLHPDGRDRNGHGIWGKVSQ